MTRSDKQRWLAAAMGTALAIPGLLWGAEGPPRPTRVKPAAAQAREPDALPPIVSAETLAKPTGSTSRREAPATSRSTARAEGKSAPLSPWMQEIDPAVKDDKPAQVKQTSKTPAAPQAAKAAPTNGVEVLLGRMRAAASAIVQERSPAEKATANGKRTASVAAVVEPVRFQATIEDQTAMVVKIQTDDDPEAQPIDDVAPIHSTQADEEKQDDEELPPRAIPKTPPAASARRPRTALTKKEDSSGAERVGNRNTQSLKLLVKIDPDPDSAETEPKYLLLDDILKQLYPDRDVSVFFVPDGFEAEAGK